jgi:hypothetical protein
LANDVLWHWNKHQELSAESQRLFSLIMREQSDEAAKLFEVYCNHADFNNNARWKAALTPELRDKLSRAIELHEDSARYWPWLMRMASTPRNRST